MANKNARRNDPAYAQFYGKDYGRDYKIPKKRGQTKPRTEQNITINYEGKVVTTPITDDDAKARQTRRKIEQIDFDRILSEEIREVWS